VTLFASGEISWKNTLFILQELSGIGWSEFSEGNSRSSESHHILQRRNKVTTSVFLSAGLGEIGP
jgi:hypothetical protein